MEKLIAVWNGCMYFYVRQNPPTRNRLVYMWIPLLHPFNIPVCFILHIRMREYLDNRARQIPDGLGLDISQYFIFENSV